MNASGCATGRRTGRRRRQRGFALLLVFLMAAMVAVALYRELPRVAFQAQREKEELLIERGEQYKRAVRVFYRQFQRFPPTLDALENTNNIRFLRKRFKDPMTGKDEWRLVEASSLMKKQQGKGKGDVGKSVEELAQEQQGGAQNQVRQPWNRLRPSDTQGFNQQASYSPQQPYSPPSGQAFPDSAGPGENASDEGQQSQQGEQLTQYPGQQPGPGQTAGPGQPLAPGQQVPGGPVVVQQPAFPWQQQGQPGQQQPGQAPGQVVYQPGGVPYQGGPQAGQYPQIPGQPGQVQPGQPGDPNYQQPNAPVINPNTGQPETYGQRLRRQIGSAGAVSGNQGPPDPNNPADPYNPNRPPGTYPNQPGTNPNQPGTYPNQGSSPGSFSGGGATGGTNPALLNINEQLTNPRQQNRMGQNSPFAAGGIVGVASKSEDEGIKLYKERSKYKEWEFVYDPTEEMAAGAGMPGVNPNPTRQGGMTGGPPSSGPFGPSGPGNRNR